MLHARYQFNCRERLVSGILRSQPRFAHPLNHFLDSGRQQQIEVEISGREIGFHFCGYIRDQKTHQYWYAVDINQKLRDFISQLADSVC
jgi:hypothetical protein